MKPNLPSIGNEKMNSLLKEFNRAMQKIPTFDQYFPDARPRYILEEKQSRAKGFRKQLSDLFNEFEQEKTKREIALNQIKNGNLNNEGYSSSALRQIAVSEYNSAVLLANAKPENIDKIINDATNQKRTEFVFSLSNLLLDQKNLDRATRHKVEYALKTAKEKFGITKLEEELKLYSDYAEEVLEHSALLESDVLEFEKQAALQVRIEEAMETGAKYTLDEPISIKMERANGNN